MNITLAWGQRMTLAMAFVAAIAFLLFRPATTPARLPAIVPAIAAPAPAATPTATPTPAPTPIPAEWRKIGSFPEPIGALKIASDGEIRAFGLGGAWVSRDNGNAWILRPFTAEEDSWVSLFDGNPHLAKSWVDWPAVASQMSPKLPWEYRLAENGQLAAIFCRPWNAGDPAIVRLFWLNGNDWRALEAPPVKFVAVNAVTAGEGNLYLANHGEVWQAKNPLK